MRVTEFNVGRWCLGEDECRAQGIDFAAYERGVNDAAQAFARNPQPTSPILTDEEWQEVADAADRIIPGRVIEAIEERIRRKLAHGVAAAPGGFYLATHDEVTLQLDGGEPRVLKHEHVESYLSSGWKVRPALTVVCPECEASHGVKERQ
jgi:hypothetical protein